MTTTAPQDIVPFMNTHSMRTRGKSGFRRPVDHLNLNAAVLSLVLTSVRTALSDPAWRLTMQAEFDPL